MTSYKSQTLLWHVLVLGLAALSLLSSCSAPDAGVSDLKQNILTSPAPNAITGMWHRRSTGNFGRVDHLTLLLRADGTGMVKLNAAGGTSYNGPMMIGADGQMFDSSQPQAVNWRYTGSGKWMIRGITPGDTREHLCQTTGDTLLVAGKAAFQRQ